VIDRKVFFFSASAGRTVDATDFATEAVHFALAERVIAAWKSASSLSAASLCIVSVTCEYKSNVVVIVA
jgi:hypothetical protein